MYSEFLTIRYHQTALKIKRLTRVYESLRSTKQPSDDIYDAIHLIKTELNNLLDHQATQADRIREALDQERK